MSAESHYISRQCCGSRRPFTMSLQDQHRRKIIYIKRSFGCSTCFCCLQHMEVQSPPGTVIGYIDQVLVCIIGRHHICLYTSATIYCGVFTRTPSVMELYSNKLQYFCCRTVPSSIPAFRSRMPMERQS